MSLLKKTTITFILSLFGSTITQAGVFPRGCEVSGFGYSDHFLILNDSGAQTLYLIQNRSDKPIELERYEAKEVFMTPKLHSKLDGMQWAAFASDVQNTHFKCYTKEGENEAMISCSDVLEVCQYPRVKFALSNMGTYWISTNKEQAQVIKEAAAKGIYLRW